MFEKYLEKALCSIVKEVQERGAESCGCIRTVVLSLPTAVTPHTVPHVW